MVHSRRARQLWHAAPLVLGTLGASASASAGSLQVRDDAHVLAPQDIARLRSEVASAPFDARLMTTTDHPESQDLARYLERFVSEGDMVVVGVDPEHRHVQVRFGTASHVPQPSRSAIEKSGNDAFRRGDWEGGAATIFRMASGAVSTAPAEGPSAMSRAAPAPASPGMILIVIGGFVGIALLAAFLLRRRNLDSMGPGPGGYAPGYGPPPYPGGGYGPPAGGMGPLGGGLIGAGLGGLAGYELGKLEGEHERGRDLGDRGEANVGGESGGNYDDGGGGGSDWGDGGGGGFDGGDGGGGGGDF
jgi:MYXO-CTERM domain-containing protein